MSLTLNMIGGGSGGFSPDNAILGIVAYPGSDVTISNGTVTKTVTADKSYLLSSSSGQAVYYFTIPPGMFDSEVSWNILASSPDKEATAEVIVDANLFYYIIIPYVVPFEYQQVEYLESNGQPYIDTRIATNAIGILNCRLMNIAYTNYTRWEDWFTFGGCNTLIGASSQVRDGFGWHADLDTRQLKIGMGSYGSGTYSTITSCYVSFIGSNRFTTINGTTYTISHATPSSSVAFCLFTIRDQNKTWVNSNNRNRIYSCEIFNFSNQKIANLIPCYRKSEDVANQVPGMYDSVRKIFLTNAGSGTFTYGPKVE